MPPEQCCQSRILASALSPDRHSPIYAYRKEMTGRFALKTLGTMFTDDVDALLFVSDWGMERAINWVATANYAAVRNLPYSSPNTDGIKGAVPLGQYPNGLPFGMMFVVRPWQEAKLISLMQVSGSYYQDLADAGLERLSRERSRKGLFLNPCGRECSAGPMELGVLIKIRYVVLKATLSHVVLLTSVRSESSRLVG